MNAEQIFTYAASMSLTPMQVHVLMRVVGSLLLCLALSRLGGPGAALELFRQGLLDMEARFDILRMTHTRTQLAMPLSTCQGLRCATHGCLEEFAEINPDEFASVEEPGQGH